VFSLRSHSDDVFFDICSHCLAGGIENKYTIDARTEVTAHQAEDDDSDGEDGDEEEEEDSEAVDRMAAENEIDDAQEDVELQSFDDQN